MNTTYIIIIASGVILWLLTALALIDVITKDFGSLKNKVIWFVIAFIPVIGWLIYLLFGFKKGIRKKFQD
ncbi:MAG: PLDc N-terminal domain-containing protein [Desulfobacteraceae bacterium]|nr:PLDc N-terminal domain-containing protein [Desulfobacteraceae bacterium]